MKVRQFVLASRPSGLPVEGNFRIENKELPELKEDEVLLKSWYISVDPYMRGRMSDAKSYSAPFEIDKPISGSAVAKVVESKSALLKPGDTVQGFLPWSTYSIGKVENFRKVDPIAFPPGYYLGVLGMPGLTAYFGIMDIGKPKPGETVVISGAAGAVGIVAGQISRMLGARVIGITGSDEKCKLIVEEFGFDSAINYKTAKSLRNDIQDMCPKGVDIYYDNVGGEISDAVISNLKFHARIVLCGQISQYNNTRIHMGPAILPILLTRSVMLQGFIVSNYTERFSEGYEHLGKWVSEGKIKYRETIIHGFDQLPRALSGLFSGENKGKMLVETE